MLGLIDDLPDADRLATAGAYHEPLDLDYEGLLAHMLRSTSESVQELTVFHIGELRLAQFEPQLEQLAEREHEPGDISRSLLLLREAARAG